MQKFYYHLTHPKNIISILTEGLKANNDGEIFVFEDKTIIPTKQLQEIGYEPFLVADAIALEQVFIDEYVMFEIDSNGIKKEPINDNVAEFSAQCQWIVKQKVIEPKYLKLVGRYKTKNPLHPKVAAKIKEFKENSQPTTLDAILPKKDN